MQGLGEGLGREGTEKGTNINQLWLFWFLSKCCEEPGAHRLGLLPLSSLCWYLAAGLDPWDWRLRRVCATELASALTRLCAWARDP